MKNIWTILQHALVSAALFAIPLIIVSGHAWTDLTIGTVLNGFYHWLVLQNQS